MQVWALSAKAFPFLDDVLALLRTIGVADVRQCRVKSGITIKTGIGIKTGGSAEVVCYAARTTTPSAM